LIRFWNRESIEDENKKEKEERAMKDRR